MAYYEDLNVDQGTDATFEIRLLNSDGSKRDVTNYTVTGRLNRSYDADSDEGISFVTEIISPPTAGIVNISLTNTQTALLNPKKTYVYDVNVSYDDNGSTRIERLMEGKVYVSPSVK
jgi:hypothetical protein